MINATFEICTHPVSVTWAAGKVTGVAGAVSYIQALATQMEGHEVAIPGFAGTTTNHLAEARSFIALCWLASDSGTGVTVTGDEPELQSDDEPGGAVI
jgi:hypothetical protein